MPTAEEDSLADQMKAIRLEMSAGFDRVLATMEKAGEEERSEAVKLALAKAEKDKEVAVAAAIAKTKKKRWCALCGDEAKLFCCFNGFYCDSGEDKLSRALLPCWT